jgi:DnaJ-class molecular chaperone
VEKNYYQLFGIDQNASAEQIKKSSDILLDKYKPDEYSVEPEDDILVIKNINHIYEVLSDPEKRKAYDIKLNKEAEEEQTETPSFIIDENSPGAFVPSNPYSPLLGIKNERPTKELKEEPIKLSESLKWIIRILVFGLTMYGIIHKYVN